jgi:hypothetical protein
MKLISFSALPCRKKINDSSRLNMVEIALVTWHDYFQLQKLYKQETICKSAQEQTPLSNDTADSVLRHREVGRAKELSAQTSILSV